MRPAPCPLSALSRRLATARRRVALARMSGMPAPTSATIAHRVATYLALRNLTVASASGMHDAWRAGLPVSPAVVRAYLQACLAALRP